MKDVKGPSRRVRPIATLGTACVAALLLALATAGSAAAERGFVCQITASETPTSAECGGGGPVPGGAFTNNRAVAVDSADDIWVSDTGTSRVSKFDSGGNFLAQHDGSGSWNGSPYIWDLAFGAGAGFVYAADSSSSSASRAHSARCW